MPGITFGRSAGKRIVDGIRKIERIPGGEENLPRQRGGGLGRSTLWEVTAVQTGPETVTIKRVHNIDFDLNDPSEKEDIFYDPNDEPSVGDRGLLIRLGEGSLFFFRREVLDRIYFNEVCYVDSANPGSTFGYPTVALARKDETGNRKRIAIAKFASRLPNSTIRRQDITLLMPTIQRGDDGVLSYDPTTGNNNYVEIEITSIDNDFDPSTLNYTQYLALSKTLLTRFSALSYLSANLTSRALGRNLYPDTTPGILFRHATISGGGLEDLFSNQAYGVAFSIRHRVALDGYSEVQLELESIGSKSAKTGWIEWWR